jgi:hypothetical protein
MARQILQVLDLPTHFQNAPEQKERTFPVSDAWQTLRGPG